MTMTRTRIIQLILAVAICVAALTTFFLSRRSHPKADSYTTTVPEKDTGEVTGTVWFHKTTGDVPATGVLLYVGSKSVITNKDGNYTLQTVEQGSLPVSIVKAKNSLYRFDGDQEPYIQLQIGDTVHQDFYLTN